MKRGFTLIELMVTVAIFVFMTALILSRYSAYNSGTLLTDAAYDVALTIHQAQTFGISVVGANPTVPSFSSTYGVDFDTANPTQYTYYYDTAAYGAQFVGLPFDTFVAGQPQANVINTYVFKNGFKLKSICVVDISRCSDDETQRLGSGWGVDPSIQKLDIQFVRPDPSPVTFKYWNQNTSGWYGPLYGVKIILQSADGQSTRIIDVSSVGQVSIENY